CPSFRIPTSFPAASSPSDYAPAAGDAKPFRQIEKQAREDAAWPILAGRDGRRGRGCRLRARLPVGCGELLVIAVSREAGAVVAARESLPVTTAERIVEPGSGDEAAHQPQLAVQAGA